MGISAYQKRNLQISHPEAMKLREKQRIKHLELASPERSHRANQFPVRSLDGAAYDAMPAGVKNFSDNFVVNAVNNAALAGHDTDNTKRAVNTENIKDGALTGRMINDPGSSNRWAKANVPADTVFKTADGGKIPMDDLNNNIITKNANNEIADTLIPRKFVRGDKDGNLPYGSLSGKPDLSRFLTSVPSGYVKSSELRDSAFK